ncbi:MAG: class I SAM-dependent methyltransferase [Nocardioides sp.]
MRRGYVAAVRLVRAVLALTGLLRILDAGARRSRTLGWVRSWLAVYDLTDMLRLDTPWWTYEASDLVAGFLQRRPDARVFEWGSGASTVWLSRRSTQVVSIEHDDAWARRLAEVVPANTTLLLREPAAAGPGAVGSSKRGFAGLDFTSYVAAIDQVDGELDLIVIDGRAREACLERAVERLAPGGLIVLDNVERARYRRAIERRPAGLAVRWTRGRTPTLPYPTATALISRSP